MNYTSVEQSKELLKLGLDENTADMMHIGTRPFMPEFDKERVEKTLIGTTKQRGHWNIPSWSLDALMDLIPHCIQGRSGDSLFLGSDLFRNEVWYEKTYLSGNTNKIFTFRGESALGVCYNTIIWLLNNKYISSCQTSSRHQ